MNYEQALEYIHAVQWAGHKPGLSRTRTLLAALGDPHKKLQFVHVAGTNGKGSTAAMLASCLHAAGYRVGLYTSPFINRFNERIQIDGQQIGDEELVQLVERVKPAADAMTDVPTEFEIITALGMLYFAQQQCDIVVLEVGLGGTLDSTNVIEKPACAVITALGMDHVKELGPTLADIAAAKAGIIKAGCPVVSYGGAPEADAVLRRVAARQHAPFTEVDFGKLRVEGGDLDKVTFDFDGLDGVQLPLIGSYQPRNAALAITALRVLRQNGWHIPDAAIRTGLEQVSWPGRFELLRRSPAFVLDGSHDARHGAEPERPVPGAEICVPGQHHGGQGCGRDAGFAGTAGGAVCDRNSPQSPRHASADAGRAHPRLRLHRRSGGQHRGRCGTRSTAGRRRPGVCVGYPVFLRRCPAGLCTHERPEELLTAALSGQPDKKKKRWPVQVGSSLFSFLTEQAG